ADVVEVGTERTAAPAARDALLDRRSARGVDARMGVPHRMRRRGPARAGRALARPQRRGARAPDRLVRARADRRAVELRGRGHGRPDRHRVPSARGTREGSRLGRGHGRPRARGDRLGPRRVGSLRRRVTTVVKALFALLLGTSLIVIGTGLLGTALALQADRLGFSGTLTGIVMSAYFAGYVLGTYVCPKIVRSAGHVRAFSAFAATAASAVLLHPLLVHSAVWTALR